MKILVVEDDIYIGNLIEELLCNKYNIYRAYSGSEALLYFDKEKFDLVLLDLMLPGVSGEEVLNKIKGKSKVIIISAKISIDDKVNNLVNGACDYITKPFDNKELIARVDAQLRVYEEQPKIITYAEIRIDLEKVLVFINNQELKLTKLEFGILVFLFQNPNKVFSRNQIFEKVWNYESIGNEESVKVHISNLRMKIAEHSAKKYIDTVWGIGFKFIKE